MLLGTNTSFDAFRQSEGRHAEKVLLSMSKKACFVEALSTSLGQELLRDLIHLYEENVEKVVVGKATERNNETIVVCRYLIGLWTDRINSYNQNVVKLKQGV
jgi:hypothetical protein